MTYTFLIKRLPTRLLVSVAVLIFLSTGLKSCSNTAHHLSFMPEDMAVQKVIYSEEKVWGFGPGGNETGVIVYELPSSTVERIQAIGPDYFSALPTGTANDDQNRRGFYAKWNPTPIAKNDEQWFRIPVSDETTSSPNLDNYLGRYGYDLPITPEIEALVNEVIAMPGSFYSYGRGGGVIVVAPEVSRVFYVYSG